MIAVTAASGGMGSRVASRLSQLGSPVTLIVRDPVRAPNLDGARVQSAGSYGDLSAMRAALSAVDTLLLIPMTEAPDRAEQQATVIRAAVEANVRRVVYLSFVRATESNTFSLAVDHARTEHALTESGLDFTFVRMNLYADFIPNIVGADGVIRGPAGDGVIAPVTRDDLADVLTAVLLSDGYSRDTITVSGPQELTLSEIAAMLSRARGSEVRFVNETEEEAFASRAGLGEPWEIEAWVGFYRAIAQGILAGVTESVSEIAGHPAATFAQFLGIAAG